MQPLIKLDSVPAKVKKLRALDISLQMPNLSTHLYAMGYPKYGDPSKVPLRIGEARFSVLTSGDIIEVEQLTQAGHSGGPLLNEQGQVVGTCQEDLADNKMGRYTPTSKIVDMRTKIPVDERMLEFENQLIEG